MKTRRHEISIRYQRVNGYKLFLKDRSELIHSFIHSAFIHSRNISLKICKNKKIVNRNKADQIRAKKTYNNNNYY